MNQHTVDECMAIMTKNPKEPVRELLPVRWGFIPSWGERHLRRRETEAAMTTRRKTGFILAGIACALLIVLIFLLPILLNADRYRTKVISYLEVKTGKNVEIGRLAVTFSPG